MVHSASTTVQQHVQVVEPFAMIPEALLYDPEMEGHDVRLYGILHRHGSDPSNCYPSIERLATLIGKSESTVHRSLARLATAGWIKKVPRYADDGGQTSNGYLIYNTPHVGGDTHPPVAADTQKRAITNEKTLFGADFAAPVDNPRRRDPLMEAILSACGIESEKVPKSQWSSIGKVVRELKEVGADPDSVTARAGLYRQRFPQAALTPTALSKHWASLSSTSTNGIRVIDGKRYRFMSGSGLVEILS